ncbi:MAG: YraN family protein [Gammaproteobacteria bacterium RIFCSPHIGHO2_02_FULL_42_13]|nr:MAG: YraN family protein [Gammaproteobacteria bacterium RIFCSPHIGHO2_02_FULL_42_13]OGT70467.1 MAG: YraN family protein [Gammaproteobacteria bacterium RIFCSPLOWO2_02_FULL_42_9]
MIKRFSSSMIGKQAENQACLYLQQQGLQLVARNFSCLLGEIDLIMRDQEILVFVEVRMRSHINFMRPHETIDHRKQKKIIKTAIYYLQQRKLTSKMTCRFDVITVEQESNQLRWIKRAFEVT